MGYLAEKGRDVAAFLIGYSNTNANLNHEEVSK